MKVRERESDECACRAKTEGEDMRGNAKDIYENTVATAPRILLPADLPRSRSYLRSTRALSVMYYSCHYIPIHSSPPPSPPTVRTPSPPLQSLLLPPARYRL